MRLRLAITAPLSWFLMGGACASPSAGDVADDATTLASQGDDSGSAASGGSGSGESDSGGSGPGSGPTLQLEAPEPSAGPVAQASQPFTVSITGPLDAAVTATPSDGNDGGVFDPATVSLGPDAPSATFTYTPASAGIRSISLGNDAGLPDPAPVDYAAIDASSAVVQFLTHDGDAVGNVANSSAPTNTMWNLVLGFPWRRGGFGDWLDARQVEFGVDATGAVAHASVAVPEPARYEVEVGALVQRWLTTGENRGFYLRLRDNAFPVYFAGRAASDVDARPSLTVVTDVDTYVLPARCNASWAASTSQPISSSNQWVLSGEGPAIVQFDLATVEGAVTEATFAFTDVAHDVGSTSALGVVDVFEADPPRFVVPDAVDGGVLGLAAEHDSFAAIAGDPDVLFSDDFATPGWADDGWDHPVERAQNPETGTTYARGQFVRGSNSSANLRSDVSRGTADGTPDQVLEELFGQYHLFLESDFGSNIDGIKIPAMGVQFGYWNPVGYWQQTTGNGGSPGTGLKVWNEAQGVWEYQGHSVRILSGQRAADASAYGDLLALSLYPYNLDQQGPFPASESLPYVAIRRERWYAIDIHVKQNSIEPPLDADGNGQAVADGEYRVWINGYPALTRTGFRWRRHAEFGVQGLWVDFYHGGVPPAPYAMHYRIDRVTLARRYIGPQVASP
jgi:hypothetical protein